MNIIKTINKNLINKFKKTHMEKHLLKTKYKN